MRLAACNRCRREAWVNHATLGPFSHGELCAECFEAVPHDAPRRNRTQLSSGPNHNDPGFDNVIRAMEEDR
jgi:hypothetical protein